MIINEPLITRAHGLSAKRLERLGKRGRRTMQALVKATNDTIGIQLRSSVAMCVPRMHLPKGVGGYRLLIVEAGVQSYARQRPIVTSTS